MCGPRRDTASGQSILPFGSLGYGVMLDAIAFGCIRVDPYWKEKMRSFGSWGVCTLRLVIDGDGTCLIVDQFAKRVWFFFFFFLGGGCSEYLLVWSI